MDTPNSPESPSRARRTFIAVAATAVAVVGLLTGCGRSDEPSGTEPAAAIPGHYAQVNGLKMYYEVHGQANGQAPLVLLHGGLSGIGSSFGRVLPDLAKGRQVIGVEQQGHARTADIDRPLRYETMADDTVALLQQLGIRQADFFGYSDGAAVALSIGIRHPDIAHKLVLASVAYRPDGMQPGQHESLQTLRPEMMEGSVFKDEYDRIAPRRQDFPTLVEKIKDLDAHAPAYTPDQIRSLHAPVLILAADNDIFRPEHTIEMYRLLGGGIDGIPGLPESRLAVVPGTSHLTLIDKTPSVLLQIIPDFLNTAKLQR
ncbi:MAG: alpha/beta hydrolase [Mycobacteriaceae bacterium]|nr:alpha/beta hydrolase [Mycobacteriaceae bacterium]